MKRILMLLFGFLILAPAADANGVVRGRSFGARGFNQRFFAPRAYGYRGARFFAPTYYRQRIVIGSYYDYGAALARQRALAFAYRSYQYSGDECLPPAPPPMTYSDEVPPVDCPDAGAGLIQRDYAPSSYDSYGVYRSRGLFGTGYYRGRGLSYFNRGVVFRDRFRGRNFFNQRNALRFRGPAGRTVVRGVGARGAGVKIVVPRGAGQRRALRR